MYISLSLYTYIYIYTYYKGRWKSVWTLEILWPEKRFTAPELILTSD